MEDSVINNNTYVDMNAKSKKQKIFNGLIVAFEVIVIFGSIVLAVLVSFFSSYGDSKIDITIDTSEWEPPTYESTLTKIIPTQNKELQELTEEEKINTIYYLYRLANKNHIGEHGSIYITNATVKTTVKALNLPINVRVFGHTICTPNEFYQYEHRFAEGAVKKIVGLVPGALFSVRNYQNLDMDYLYSEKSESSTFNAETKNAVVDWDKQVKGYSNEQPKKIFSYKQNQEFFITDQNVLPETIKNPTIEFVRTNVGNYYSLSFDLDVSNPKTYERSIDGLRTGLSDGNYTSIHENVEIWENGYYKRFVSLDKAENSGLALDMDFDFIFYYSDGFKSIADLDGFDDYSEVIERLNTYQAQ